MFLTLWAVLKPCCHAMRLSMCGACCRAWRAVGTPVRAVGTPGWKGSVIHHGQVRASPRACLVTSIFSEVDVTISNFLFLVSGGNLKPILKMLKHLENFSLKSLKSRHFCKCSEEILASPVLQEIALND